MNVNHPRSHLNAALSAQRGRTELNQANGASLRPEVRRVHVQNKSVAVKQMQSASVLSDIKADIVFVSLVDL